MVRFKLDATVPPGLTADQEARLASMTDAEITAAAEADPDNPPLSEEELSRMAAARFVRSVREGTGLTQAGFASAFRIGIGRLRDLEQGRSRADSALLAYLTVIAREPGTVRRVLASEDTMNA